MTMVKPGDMVGEDLVIAVYAEDEKKTVLVYLTPEPKLWTCVIEGYDPCADACARPSDGRQLTIPR